MTSEEFWHKETGLFYAYQKAYYMRLYETAWVNGLYVDIALNNLGANILRKKGEKTKKYPNEPYNPFKKAQKLSPIQKENKFRSMMEDINLWVEEGVKGYN